MLFLQRTIGNQAVEKSVRSAVRTPGQPLDVATRALMESHFGQDLGDVRVHTDAHAAESAAAIGANAYTVGHEVVFGAGEYAPKTTEGRALLAHELAHTIQQRDPGAPPPSNAPQGVHEISARQAAKGVATGQPAQAPMPSAGLGVSMNAVPERELAEREARAEVERMNKDQKKEEEEEKAADQQQQELAERDRRPRTLSLLKPDPRFHESLRISDEMDAQAKRRRESEEAEEAKRIQKIAEDRAAQARNDAYRRHLKAPGRQYARDYGVMGAPTILVAKVAAKAWEKVEQVIPPELSVAVAPGSVLLANNSRRLEEVEAEIAAEKDARDMLGEAQTAHAHGELFQLPIVVASTDAIDESPDPMVAAGITAPVGKPARSPARVEGFIKDITAIYRNEIAAARQANPTGTASSHGIIAEQRTLAQVDAVARRRGLNPGHIQVGNFPMGITGPKGGVVSAEMGSPHYGFIVELKKSPKAVGKFQAEAHLVAVQNSLNFPHGGLYTRIYGEGYKGPGADRLKMGTELERQRAERRRAPRGRIRIR